MNSLAFLALGCLWTGIANAGSPVSWEAKIFDVTPHDLVPTTQVGDSVFYYEPSELICDPKADTEVPCLATVDHWDSVCFTGEMVTLCSAFEKLFKESSEKLLENGAEEDLELLSCSVDTGIPVMSFHLLSYHGGSNVLVKNKMIPMCPIFID